jgi:hypothetical protein
MLYYSIVGVVESLLKLAVALLVVVYGGDKLVLYGILMAIIPLITMTIMRIYCHRKYTECVIAPRKYWNKVFPHRWLSTDPLAEHRPKVCERSSRSQRRKKIFKVTL